MNRLNAEGYNDPTAEQAIGHIIKEERRKMDQQVSELIHSMRDMAAVKGFEIIGRVTVKHKESGKVFK